VSIGCTINNQKFESNNILIFNILKFDNIITMNREESPAVPVAVSQPIPINNPQPAIKSYYFDPEAYLTDPRNTVYRVLPNGCVQKCPPPTYKVYRLRSTTAIDKLANHQNAH
jgi:hypothetical protein